MHALFLVSTLFPMASLAFDRAVKRNSAPCTTLEIYPNRLKGTTRSAISQGSISIFFSSRELVAEGVFL